MQNQIIEGVQLAFRNFSGKPGEYNREGDRNFCMFLPQDVANEMATAGWNIKYLKPRDEYTEPQAYLKVKVNMRGPRPPRIIMVGSKNKTEMAEDDLKIADWMDLGLCDVIISPYEYNVNGNTGISAYLQKIFLVLNEDRLDEKYAELPDSAQSSMLAIEAGDDSIEGEIVYDQEGRMIEA